MLAANMPVQAPVPGIGIATNKSNAKYNPRPAFSCNFSPPFSPFFKKMKKFFLCTSYYFPILTIFLQKEIL